MLQLLGLCSTDLAATEVAKRYGGHAWIAHSGEADTAPYHGMFAVATDDLEAATAAADVGLHLIFARTIKPAEASAPSDRVIASFGMVRHHSLTHRASDDHWRDIHGPLALRCHLAMCDYQQFSILATLSGAALDGMAMCAFPDRATLSAKFFNDDAAKAEIIADVSTFADTRASLPRVVLTQAI
ncbi:MAG: EthD domain-containing protein [Actinomycetota bacterium]